MIEQFVIKEKTNIKLQRVLLMNKISLAFALIGMPYVFIFYFISPYLSALSMAFISIFFVSIYLTRFGYFKTAKLVSILNAVSVLLVYSLLFGRESGIHFVYFAIVAIPFVVFQKEERRCILASISCIVLSFFITENFSGWFHTIFTMPVLVLKIIRVGAITATFTVGLIYVYFYDSHREEAETARLQKDLEIQTKLYNDLKQESEEKKNALMLAESEKEQKEAALEREKGYVAELLEKSTRLDRSLVIVEDVIRAGKAQQEILPKGKPTFVDLVLKNYAARHLAGDFVYWKECGSKTLVVMGDVQGKGADAGFAAGIVADRLSVFVEQKGEALSLEALDTFFRLNIAEHPITRRKAVAVVAILVDIQARSLAYLNAGIHTQPILCRRSEGCTQLECSGPAYGMVDEPLGVEVFTIEKGDRFLCVSDGVEDLRNELGDSFGAERAEKLCKEITDLEFEVVSGHLDQHIHGFKGTADFIDDISVVVMDVIG